MMELSQRSETLQKLRDEEQAVKSGEKQMAQISLESSDSNDE